MPVLALAMEGKAPVAGKPTAYLCRDFACLPPITDAAELEAKLRT